MSIIVKVYIGAGDELQKIGFIIILMIVQFGNCKSADLNLINDRSTRLYFEAEKLIETGNEEEAAKILSLLSYLHPEDENVIKLTGKLSPYVRKMIHPDGTFAGFNSRAKVKTRSSAWVKILMYIPNRILDLFDIFSFRINYGPQAGASVWVTRAAQVSIYAGHTTGITSGFFFPEQKKNYGAYREAGFEIALGPGGMGYYNMSAEKNGTSGTHFGESRRWFNSPYDSINQEYRDYWSVGGKIGAVYVGFEFEFHLLEFLDFYAGFLFLDFLNDDLGSSRRYDFTKYQNRLLKDVLVNVRRAGKAGVHVYRKNYPAIGLSKDRVGADAL